MIEVNHIFSTIRHFESQGASGLVPRFDAENPLPHIPVVGTYFPPAEDSHTDLRGAIRKYDYRSR